MDLKLKVLVVNEVKWQGLRVQHMEEAQWQVTWLGLDKKEINREWAECPGANAGVQELEHSKRLHSAGVTVRKNSECKTRRLTKSRNFWWYWPLSLSLSARTRMPVRVRVCVITCMFENVLFPYCYSGSGSTHCLPPSLYVIHRYTNSIGTQLLSANCSGPKERLSEDS